MSVNGIERFRWGFATISENTDFTANLDGGSSGKILRAGNKILIPAGECIFDGYTDGTIDQLTGTISFAASAAPTYFSLGAILPHQLLFGARIKVRSIAVYYSNTNVNTFYDDFTLGNTTLNPAAAINSEYTDPTVVGDLATGNQNYTHTPIDVIFDNTIKRYALQMDITVGGGETFELIGFIITYDLVV